MHASTHHRAKKTKFSAVIPAYNEGNRIRDVLSVVMSHPLVDDVIVVSDGSTDGTAANARSMGAEVIELKRNVGKGEAMGRGVRLARHDVIAFFDADLVGLTHAMIDKMLGEVLSGRHDMFTLIRDRRSETFQLRIADAYVVGGERALRRKLWDLVPARDRQGFQVELALNYYAQRAGRRIGSALAPGLGQIAKERKRGLVRGFLLRLKMTWDCLLALGKLHILSMRRLPA